MPSVPVKAPLSKAIRIKTDNEKMVKRNDTKSDSASPASGRPGFASTPTRYLSSNAIFGIVPIAVDHPVGVPYPDFLGSTVNNADFFQSQTPVSDNLPSTQNPNRFK